MYSFMLPAIMVFLPMISVFAVYAIDNGKDYLRDRLLICVTGAVFALGLFGAIWSQGAQLRIFGVAGLSFSLSFDGFRVIYCCIAGFLWLITALASEEYFSRTKNSNNRYRICSMLTFGAALGVFFAADFFTTLMFFEMMSFTSYAMVAHEESIQAMRAGETYLAIAVMGGLAMLMGLLLIWQRTGTLMYSELYEICSAMLDKSGLYLPGTLLLIGFGAKAGMFPLHVWLPRAYVAAPAPASALLTGVLSKTGVFGVAIVSCWLFAGDISWGAALLVPATITMFLGAVLGVFSNNIKRTLACSSISQIGFVLTGIAMQCLLGNHNALAVRGTLLHMLNHSLIKLVLFLSVGVIYMNQRDLSLDGIRGFGRGKPLFFFAFLMGALGICGFPLWNGYISKTLLHESLIEAIHLYSGHAMEVPLRLVEGVFVFTCGLTIAYMLKLFVVLFVQRGIKDAEKKRYIGLRSAIALTISAALLPILGAFTAIPDALADWGQGFFHGHAPEHAVHYFIWENLRSTLVTTLIGVCIYVFFVRGVLLKRGKNGTTCYVDLLPNWLDIENSFYRPLLKGCVTIVEHIARFAAAAPDALIQLALRTIVEHVTRFLAAIPDALIQLVLRTVLSSSKKPYVPRKFLTRHIWVTERQQDSNGSETIVAGGFSMALLLVGVGLCVVVVFLFYQAISQIG